MRRHLACFALSAFLIVAAGYAARSLAQSAPTDMALGDKTSALDYLVQSVCIDASGNPTDRVPIDADCTRSRPMTEDDPVRWRKHDWGGGVGQLTGWQASDAVIARRNGVAFIDQTFDFGAPVTDNTGRPDRFFHLDQNDGGDAIRIVGDTASAFLTQDGGTPGLQWFIGPGCSQPGPGRYVSWVLFKSDVDASWRSLVAELGDDPQDACPSRLNHAFTRYRLVSESFPFQRSAADGIPTRQTAALPTILVEHYDARSIDRAHAMERFYFARGMGKVRWEAWSKDDQKSSQAEAFAGSGRCAALPDATPPDTGWRILDCRMWTNIVSDPGRSSWRVRDFGWPPADLTLQ
jgi:hypothetical protein